ncbi:MAG: winged helix-turn-helix domain-containing protein [Patescibacteria group bacterium]|nr:winged helix-turn-helix domain-containing protein [Patescibacteria group bacterium]
MKNILEKLFGSKTRVKILSLFVKNPNSSFYVREITRKLQERINSIRRELENLVSVGILKTFDQDQKKFYKVNKECNIFEELSVLVLKANIVPKEKVADEIKKIQSIDFAALSGIFTRSDSRVDILIIGDNVEKNKLVKIINELEKQQGQELNYTIMSKKEFDYRRKIDDQFLRSILDKKHKVLVDKLKEEKHRKKEQEFGMKLFR